MARAMGVQCRGNLSPGGAKEQTTRSALSPLRGYVYLDLTKTHGSRRGLYSAAAPRLGKRMHRGVMFQYFEWNCRNDGSLWRELASRARELRNLGATAVWMPPAYKAMCGI